MHFTAEEIQNTSAGLNREKQGETHLPVLDSVSQALRALSAVLIGRSRASLVIGHQNFPKKRNVPTRQIQATRDYTLSDLPFASLAYKETYQVR